MPIKALRYFLSFVCMLIAYQLSAVRAIPDTLHVRQPDGSMLSVRLHGDERSHYMTTADNLMILQDNDGTYRYAVRIADKVHPGTLPARNANQRSVSEKAFLQSIDQKQLLNVKKLSAAQRTSALTNSSQLTSLGKRLMNLAKNKEASGTNQASSTMQLKELVILVNYSDTVFTTQSPQTAFDNLFNQNGYNVNGSSGSVRNFYYDNSMGNLTFNFTVVGPVTLPHPMAYYGANDSNGDDIHPSNMVPDACQLVASSVDFSQFDNDGDGYVDNVFIIYAGHNEAEGGPASSVWPHEWTLDKAGITLPSYNGVKVNTYACTSELKGDATSKTISPIGTFCHEFGHTLGLLDLYDTDYNGTGTEAGGLANWDLMSTGNYNNGGRTPPFLCAINRWILGWTDTQTPVSTQTNTLSPIGTSNQVYRIDLPTNNEFYLLENRQQTSWDTYLNGHGMLITHIDMTNMTPWINNVVNVDPSHQYADLIEADGNETYSANGIAGDPYPGTSKKTEFSDASYPAMGSWYTSTKIHKPITDISENTDITFNYCGGPDGALTVPVATKATQVNDTSFVANWDVIKGSNIDYYLDVYCKGYVNSTEDFSAFFTETNVNGWSGNYDISSITYNSSPCAINLNAKKDTLVSNLFDGAIRSFSFWGMSDGTPGTSVRIDVYNGTEWQTLQSGLALSLTSATYTYSSSSTPSLPDNIVQIRFIFTGSAGNIYLDDVTASYYGNTYLSGYQNKEMGSATSAEVHPVVKKQTYYYLVRAQSPTLVSANSNIIEVIPVQSRNSVLANAYVSNGNLIVEAHDINSNTVQVYTCVGQKIMEKNITQGSHNLGALQPHGLYLVVVNGRSFKVIF